MAERLAFENLTGRYSFEDLTDADRSAAMVRLASKQMRGEDGLEAGIEEAKQAAANRRLKLVEDDSKSFLESVINGEDPTVAIKRFKRTDPNVAYQLWNQKKMQDREDLIARHSAGAVMAANEGLGFEDIYSTFTHMSPEAIVEVNRILRGTTDLENQSKVRLGEEKARGEQGLEQKKKEDEYTSQVNAKKARNLAVLAAVGGLTGAQAPAPEGQAEMPDQFMENLLSIDNPALPMVGSQGTRVPGSPLLSNVPAMSPDFLQAIEGIPGALGLTGVEPDDQVNALIKGSEGFAEIFPEYLGLQKEKRTERRQQAQEDRLEQARKQAQSHQEWMEQRGMTQDERAEERLALERRRVELAEQMERNRERTRRLRLTLADKKEALKNSKQVSAKEAEAEAVGILGFDGAKFRGEMFDPSLVTTEDIQTALEWLEMSGNRAEELGDKKTVEQIDMIFRRVDLLLGGKKGK